MAKIATVWQIRGLQQQSTLLEELRAGDDWLLIVLDACRYDSLATVFDTYFKGDIRPVSSVGHDTFEYVRLCWPDVYEDVAYISGAPAINSGDISFDDEWLEGLYDGYTPAEHLPNIVDALRDGWDLSLGTCPPEPLTEAALDRDDSQMVVHYIQPHTPFIGEKQELGHHDSESADPFEGNPTDEPIWRKVRSGELTDDRLHKLYNSNLQRVLPEVARLVDGSDADRIIVTADHGEALGEYGIYAHPRRDHPYVRTVPWAEVEKIRDSVDYTNDYQQKPTNREVVNDVENRLRDLGYVN